MRYLLLSVLVVCAIGIMIPSVFADKHWFIEHQDEFTTNEFTILSGGQNFEITFTANYQVLSGTFNPNTKTLQFEVNSGLGGSGPPYPNEETYADRHFTSNIGEIIIPRELLDGEFRTWINRCEIALWWGSECWYFGAPGYIINKTDRSSVVSLIFQDYYPDSRISTGSSDSTYTIKITATKHLERGECDAKKGVTCASPHQTWDSRILANPNPATKPPTDTGVGVPGRGGCLIATATFGSEMAPQVQFLREIRDNTVLQTESGSTFMTGFNQFYYSFSPAVADYERENPAFKEAVKVTLTPLLASLTLLQYADIDSESEMLGYGIGVILLNIGMYFVAPAVLIMKVRKRI
jgi:hypothetical protein